MSGRELVKKLVLPYESMRTVYEGASEVRLYRNTIIGGYQIGKRIDTLGIENTVAANEGALLKSITHDNIAPLDDVVTVEGFTPPMSAIELIMPYYERGSVFDALQRGQRFSVRDACRYMQSALRGLAELHERHGILHRDVKSPNLLLAEDHTLIKIGDLGIAISMSSDGSAEAYPRVQIYSPPEVLTIGRVDRRSDIYGMGLVFVELLTGPFPYTEYSVTQCEKRLSHGHPAIRTSDVSLDPHVPRDLRRVVRKATHKDPSGRYATAQAMSEKIAASRLVDWSLTLDDPDEKIWEGDSATRRDRRYRIEAARRTRRGGWVLRGLQRRNRWQRVVPDGIISDLRSHQATAFFDQVVAIATAT